MMVNNNIPAFDVWVNYSNNVTQLQSAMSKLSSGQQIENAGDNPAGLAMSERLIAQYQDTDEAESNVQNQINYLQTSDAWMQQINNISGRMAELAVMANDGTKSQVDRDNLQDEFSQMQQEIRRITTGATAAGKFNGLYLFRGGNGVAAITGDTIQKGNVRIQVGPDSNQVFNDESLNLSASNFNVIGSYNTYSYGSVNMTLLGSHLKTVTWGSLICGQNLSISVQSVAQAAVDKMNLGIDYISQKRAVLGAEMSRMQQTLSGLQSYDENIRATESSIRDCDVAYEATQYAKYSILTQIGTAMLAQANQLPASVMQLLG